MHFFFCCFLLCVCICGRVCFIRDRLALKFRVRFSWTRSFYLFIEVFYSCNGYFLLEMLQLTVLQFFFIFFFGAQVRIMLLILGDAVVLLFFFCFPKRFEKDSGWWNANPRSIRL